ncbi:MAG: type III pantothenate kinase, partial [Candidatus Thermochlorobacter sp.]
MSATKPILALDIGNTHTTLAALKGKKILWRSTVKTAHLHSQHNAKHVAKVWGEDICKSSEQVQCIGVASVVPRVVQTVLPWLEKSLRAPSLIISASLKLPFEIRYQTPQTLGADRIAATAFAAEHFPHQAVIVIDFGTAVTYDVLTSSAHYLGGLILAGAHTTAAALWQRAA